MPGVGGSRRDGGGVDPADAGAQPPGALRAPAGAVPDIILGMASTYLWLKYLHVLLAIVAVGFNAAYGLIIARARTTGPDAPELRYALRTVKVMDDYVANPAYILLFLTGLATAHVGGIPMSAKWIHGSMALLFIALALGYGLYTPTLRKQIAVLEARGASDPEFLRLSNRGRILGMVLALIVLVIVFLMVFKPV